LEEYLTVWLLKFGCNGFSVLRKYFLREIYSSNPYERKNFRASSCFLGAGNLINFESHVIDSDNYVSNVKEYLNSGYNEPSSLNDKCTVFVGTVQEHRYENHTDTVSKMSRMRLIILNTQEL
jgi:hypothetical protein